MNCGLINEYESNFCRNEHHLNSSENKKNSKIQANTGFTTMTFAMLLYPYRQGLNTFTGPIFTSDQIVFIAAKTAFKFTS